MRLTRPSVRREKRVAVAIMSLYWDSPTFAENVPYWTLKHLEERVRASDQDKINPQELIRLTERLFAALF